MDHSNEVQPLMELGISPDSVWGDDGETEVYAQVIGRGSAVVFRFQLDVNNSTQSLSNRVVSCFHDLEVAGKEHTFQDNSYMRAAIWSAVATVWPQCTLKPTTFEPGVMIDLTSTEIGEVTWLARRDSSFTQYIDMLRNIHTSDLIARDQILRIVDISEVFLLESLDGKGCCKLAQLQTSSSEAALFVFKGIDFKTYLCLHDDDDEFLRYAVDCWRQSSKLIAETPPHPNIQAPPEILVSVRSSNGDAILMGHLSPFFARGDLRTVIDKANAAGTTISTQQKVKWCHQMSQAIMHTHRVMHTYHMDIKPGNIIVDDEDNLVLIDWEQSGAPVSTLAPEADGTWDVKEHEGVEKRPSRLVYTKYTGPERRNMPEGCEAPTYVWNVYPIWQKSCPRALELAEVFALGRTMWMLLSQTDDDFEEVEHPDDVRVIWAEDSQVPSHYIKMVEKCMEKDPNERPSVVELAEFWEAELADMAMVKTMTK